MISANRNNGQQVEVAVADCGIGIDSQHRDQVFNPFFTTKSDGMGMGLAICRGIVESCGGRSGRRRTPITERRVRFALPAVVTGGV